MCFSVANILHCTAALQPPFISVFTLMLFLNCCCALDFLASSHFIYFLPCWHFHIVFVQPFIVVWDEAQRMACPACWGELNKVSPSSSPVDQHVHWWPQPIRCLHLTLPSASQTHQSPVFAFPPDLLAATSDLSTSPLTHSLTDVQSSSVWPLCFITKNIKRSPSFSSSHLWSSPSRSLPKRNRPPLISPTFISASESLPQSLQTRQTTSLFSLLFSPIAAPSSLVITPVPTFCHSLLHLFSTPSLSVTSTYAVRLH